MARLESWVELDFEQLVVATSNNAATSDHPIENLIDISSAKITGALTGLDGLV